MSAEPCATAQPASPMTGIFQALKGLLTGKDNSTLDMGRISWAVSTLALLGLAAWHERHGIAVGLQELGISLAAVVTAHGAALGLKAKTEPGGDQ